MTKPTARQHSSQRVPTSINLNGSADPGRGEAEGFIHQLFVHAYGADVQHFLPLLMGLRDDSGRLQGALGLQEAATGALFLENYLDDSVELVLSSRIGLRIDRAELVEVGNLAVATPGGSRWLITALTAFLRAADREWVVFTCGPALRNAFTRLGIELLDLGQADAARLPAAEVGRWGSYYRQAPRVLAARVAQSFEQLSRLVVGEYALHALWCCATGAGKRAV